MIEQERNQNDWELLTATSDIALAGRLKIFWEYVILGRKPFFILTAWVSPRKEGAVTIYNLKLIVTYPKRSIVKSPLTG